MPKTWNFSYRYHSVQVLTVNAHEKPTSTKSVDFVFLAYIDDTNEEYKTEMKAVAKKLNETEAENQATKLKNNTLDVNGTQFNSSDENYNGTGIERNMFPHLLEGNGTAENSGLR